MFFVDPTSSSKYSGIWRIRLETKGTPTYDLEYRRSLVTSLERVLFRGWVLLQVRYRLCVLLTFV